MRHAFRWMIRTAVSGAPQVSKPLLLFQPVAENDGGIHRPSTSLWAYCSKTCPAPKQPNVETQCKSSVHHYEDEFPGNCYQIREIQRTGCFNQPQKAKLKFGSSNDGTSNMIFCAGFIDMESEDPEFDYFSIPEDEQETRKPGNTCPCQHVSYQCKL